jgi:hypothetical protein
MRLQTMKIKRNIANKVLKERADALFADYAKTSKRKSKL